MIGEMLTLRGHLGRPKLRNDVADAFFAKKAPLGRTISSRSTEAQTTAIDQTAGLAIPTTER